MWSLNRLFAEKRQADATVSHSPCHSGCQKTRPVGAESTVFARWVRQSRNGKRRTRTGESKLRLESSHGWCLLVGRRTYRKAIAARFLVLKRPKTRNSNLPRLRT